MTRWIAAAALLVSIGASAAQDDFNLEETVRFCASCHGEAGVPVNSEYPVLWGQEYYYLYLQLRDYAAGRRQNEIMTPIASRYSREQAKALAEHFAGLTWPEIQGSTEEGDEQLAEKATVSGQCSACHGKWGGNSNVPRLKGQQAAYLRKTMLDFKNAVRTNAPDLIGTFQKLSDKEIGALARYLSTL
jgi:cytochrome c553